ncbi:defensin fusion, partial [Trifolium pratense]
APGQPLPACDIGMGLCTDECHNGCCDAKCASKYPKSGVGYCTDFHDVHYCSCLYRRR